jgi:hypothetical protein
MLSVILANQSFAVKNKMSVEAALFAHVLYTMNFWAKEVKLPEGAFKCLDIQEIRNAAPILFHKPNSQIENLLNELAKARVIELPEVSPSGDQIFYRFGEKYDEYYLYQ